MKFGEGREGGIDLAFGAGLQDRELHPRCARRRLHLSDNALGNRNVRVHEQGDDRSLGNHLEQQLQPLRHQVGCHLADAREVAARPGQARDQAAPDRIADAHEDDRDRLGCPFRRQRRRGPARCRHCGGRGLPPMRAADHSDSPPSGTRSPDFAPRHSRFRSAPDGTPLSTVRSGRAQNCRGSRPPASPSAARGGCAARSSRRPARGLTRGGSLDDPLATGVRLNARPTRDADAPHPSSWRGYLRARRCWFKEFVPPRAAVAARRNDAAGLSWSATGQEWLSGCSPGA